MNPFQSMAVLAIYGVLWWIVGEMQKQADGL